MTWIPKHSVRFALVRLLLPCFCLAISLGASDAFAQSDCNWTDADSATLSQILSMLNDGQSSWSAHSRLQTIIDLLESVSFTSNGVSWLRVPTSVSSTGGDCKFEPYDDVWLKMFFTGNEDGSSTTAPIFRYGGDRSTVQAYPAQQNLQYFLSLVLGQNVWQSSSAVTWENAFRSGVSGSSSANLGGSYTFFNVWLAEAMRRLLATNQLTATYVDMNRRSVTENLSLILMQLRDMSSNSFSQVSSEFPQEISVTNSVEVILDADYSPSLPEDTLTNVTGQVQAESWSPPSTTPLSENIGNLSNILGGNPVLTIWDVHELSLGDRTVRIPRGQIDFGGDNFSTPVYWFGMISKSIWWLLYYLALARLLRREYVYYTSLGHTEGAS